MTTTIRRFGSRARSRARRAAPSSLPALIAHARAARAPSRSTRSCSASTTRRSRPSATTAARVEEAGRGRSRSSAHARISVVQFAAVRSRLRQTASVPVRDTTAADPPSLLVREQPGQDHRAARREMLADRTARAPPAARRGCWRRSGRRARAPSMTRVAEPAAATHAHATAATPFSRTFSRATATATGSMSLASTGTCARLAMAMASTPEPVPTSSALRIGRALRQPVDGDAGSRPSCRDGRCRRPGRPRSRWRCRSAAAAAVVRAVDEEPSGAHRRQPFEALRHPVGLGQRSRSAKSGLPSASRAERRRVPPRPGSPRNRSRPASSPAVGLAEVERTASAGTASFVDGGGEGARRGASCERDGGNDGHVACASSHGEATGDGNGSASRKSGERRSPMIRHQPRTRELFACTATTWRCSGPAMRFCFRCSATIRRMPRMRRFVAARSPQLADVETDQPRWSAPRAVARGDGSAD